MLTVRKIGSMQAGDYSGYLTQRADDERKAGDVQRGDYYTGLADGSTDTAGVWRGDASALDALGVDQDSVVERGALARALRGQRADTGEQLRRPGPNGIVNSHDLTMGVPKSVSVLWAQSKPEQRAAIEQATREAAEAAVRYMALTTSCVQRRTETGERVWESARGVAAAYFVHHTARRASSADVPDPHLHVHCVVVAVERSDGRIVTPNQAAWMRHGREGGAYFRSELASRLIELGLDIEHGTGKQGRFFEVIGVPREVCERLSSRTRKVEASYAEFVARYGRPPVESELADLAVKSRERKGPETVAEIEPYWRAVAAEHGFDETAAARIWGREIDRVPDADELRKQVEADVLARIERQGATVRSRELRATAFEASAGRLAPHEAMQLVEDMQQRHELRALSDDRVTTRSVFMQERFCIDTALHLSTTRQTAPPAMAIDTAVNTTQTELGIALSREKAAAVATMTNDARIAALVGRAGTGKGVVLHAASSAYRSDGWQVLAVATQGARAQGLAEQTTGQAMTIDQLLHRTRNGRAVVDAKTVVFVDEAGMVDTHRMAELLHLTERSGASLRLVGDPAQLSAIGPGGMLPQLLALDTLPMAQLIEIHRTQHKWIRDAQNFIRAGESLRALELMDRHDALHMAATQAEARIRMVADWNRWRHDYAVGDTLMVVHTSNEDVDRVNVLAQAYRAAAHELGSDSVQSPDRDYQLHEGDRVMLRERAYYLDDPTAPRVENGTRGTVIGVDPATNTVEVAFEETGHSEQRVVTIDLDRCEALRLDYASHVYPAQGDTRSRTAELTGGPSVNRENAYVGGTRLRDRHDLYTSREALGTHGTDHDRWLRLADQMNESRAQQASIAYREQPYRKLAVEVPHPVLNRDVERLDRIERDLRAARERLDQLERSFPRDSQHRIEQHTKARTDLLEWARHADEHAERARQRLDELRPWQRDQVKHTRAELHRETQKAIDHRERARERAALIDQINRGKDSPGLWNREHGTDLAARQRAVADLTRERDEQREQVITNAIERPPRYLTRALGERPNDAAERVAWEQAVRDVETYRAKHGIHERHTALGREPNGGTQQWDFRRAVESVERARQAVGHARDAHTIAHHRAGHRRGIGRDMGGRGR